MKKLYLEIGVGTALFVMGSLTAWAQSDAKDIYLDKCATCHGTDGLGKTAKGKKVKVKSIQDTFAKMTPEEMIKVVEAGKDPDMDAYGKTFTKDQIKALVAYYRSLKK